MDYKVEFLPTMETKGIKHLTQQSHPIPSLELAKELEALLMEKDQEGYDLYQILECQRKTIVPNEDLSGFFVIFKK